MTESVGHTCLCLDFASLIIPIADVLVSNAGICPFSEFLTMPIETWERTRQVNLDGSFYIVQGIISLLKYKTDFGKA